MKIKKGDNVTILSGNDRGKTGKVIKSLPSEGKVVVEGVNIKARHKKGDEGGIIRSEYPIQVSNVTTKVSKTAKNSSSKSKSETESKPAEKKSVAKKSTAKTAVKKTSKSTTKTTKK